MKKKLQNDQMENQKKVKMQNNICYAPEDSVATVCSVDIRSLNKCYAVAYEHLSRVMSQSHL